MHPDIYRIDWYPQKSFISFSHLDAEQIGVLMQIINLIYIRNSPIENDEKFIGKSCNISKSKARRIIDELLKLGQIYLTEDHKISHKRCDLALTETRNRIEEYSKNGKNGAKIRWESKQKHEVNNGNAINSEMPNINIKENIRKKITKSSSTTNYGGKYNIDFHLSDEARLQAKENAPGWDQNYLMREYNEHISAGRFFEPNLPNLAYPSWCLAFTKGRPPDQIK